MIDLLLTSTLACICIHIGNSVVESSAKDIAVRDCFDIRAISLQVFSVIDELNMLIASHRLPPIFQAVPAQLWAMTAAAPCIVAMDSA